METIAAFGDSVLKGVVYENDHYRVTDMPFYKRCEEVLGIVVENKAKFGSTIKRGEAVFDRYLESLKDVSGRYVVLEFGGNDCDFNWKEISEDPEAEHLPMSTVQDFNSMYSYMIEKIKELGKTPALLSLPPIDSERYFRHISRDLSAENIRKWMRNDIQFITNWHERYNIEVFKIAIAHQVPVIDITSAFLEHKNYNEFLCDDGIHPNEEGHRLIAESIMKHISDRKITF